MKVHCYNVFVTCKEGLDEKDFEDEMHNFLGHLMSHKKLDSYSFNRFYDIGNFEGLPSYQVMCNFLSEEAMNDSFSYMKDKVYKDPHLPLTKITSQFKIAFSELQEYKV